MHEQGGRPDALRTERRCLGTGDTFFDLSWAYWLLFFVDERAAELVSHLRRHWATPTLSRTS